MGGVLFENLQHNNRENIAILEKYDKMTVER